MEGNTSYPVLLNAETELLITMYNKVSGPVFGVVNVVVFFLIMFDPDHSHTKYRRYLLVLQFICTGTDMFISLMSPVLIAKDWVVYPTGIMPFGLPVKTAIVVYCFLMIEIVIAYASCVLYCHRSLLPKESPFRLNRWFHPFIALLNAWLVIFVPCVHYAVTDLEYTADEIPWELRWVTTKKAYYVFHWDEDSVWILVGGELTISKILFHRQTSGGVLFSAPVYATALFVFCHMFFIIKTGMGHVSPATRKTQVRAAVSIGLQITIPSITLIGPLGYQLGTLLLRINIMPGDFLACQFSLANTHAVLNSLTILLRSKYYMKILTFPILYCAHHTVRTVRDVIDPRSSSVAPSQESRPGDAHYDPSPPSHQQNSPNQPISSDQNGQLQLSSNAQYESAVQSQPVHEVSDVQPNINSADNSDNYQ